MLREFSISNRSQDDLELLPFCESSIDVIIQWRGEEHPIRQVLPKPGSY